MFNKENKDSSCRHGILALVIVGLLGLIFIVLVFKVGFIVGSKSGYSSYKTGLSAHTGKTGNYSKNFSGHMEMAKKFSSMKKSAYSNFKVVTELTDNGFMVKDGKGNIQTVVVSADTKITKGEDAVDGVSVGDKVYVEGSSVEASLVKIYDVDTAKFKK